MARHLIKHNGAPIPMDAVRRLYNYFYGKASPI